MLVYQSVPWFSGDECQFACGLFHLNFIFFSQPTPRSTQNPTNSKKSQWNSTDPPVFFFHGQNLLKIILLVASLFFIKTNRILWDKLAWDFILENSPEALSLVGSTRGLDTRKMPCQDTVWAQLIRLWSRFLPEERSQIYGTDGTLSLFLCPKGAWV